MSLSRFLRVSALAAPLALALTGGAARAQQLVTLPPGAIVVLLPDGTAVSGGVPVRVVEAPAAMPDIARLIAAQQQMMARMMANMDALFGGPGLLAGFPGSAQPAAAAQGGVSFCQQSISVTYAGGGAPVVKVSRSGSGCGPETNSGATPAVTAPAPAPQPAARPGLLEVKDPTPIVPKPVRRPT